MNLSIKFILIYLFFLGYSCWGQDNQSEFAEEVPDPIGIDPVLVNGKFFENIYFGDIGHPFLVSDNYIQGVVVINNRRFDNQQLRYNVYANNLVVMVEDGDNRVAFIPPVEFVSEFQIYDRVFKKYTFKEGKPEFYEQVYVGKLSCLYDWSKRRIDSYHNGKTLAYKYMDEEHDSFILKNDRLYSFKRKSGFIKLFPKSVRKEIAKYFKVHQLKLKDASNEEVQALFTFCEPLMDFEVSNDTQLLNNQ